VWYPWLPIFKICLLLLHDTTGTGAHSQGERMTTHFSNAATKMTNVSALIKILVANLAIAALVATYLSSGSKNDITVGLKGSARQLQLTVADFIISNPATQVGAAPPAPAPAPLSPNPGNFINFSGSQTPDLSSQVNNLINGVNFTSSSILSFQGFSTDVGGIRSAINGTSSAIFSQAGLNNIDDIIRGINGSSFAITAGRGFAQFPQP
jgi:hypothetical protein